jgi:hypothetical protein
LSNKRVVKEDERGERDRAQIPTCPSGCFECATGIPDIAPANLSLPNTHNVVAEIAATGLNKLKQHSSQVLEDRDEFVKAIKVSWNGKPWDDEEKCLNSTLKKGIQETITKTEEEAFDEDTTMVWPGLTAGPACT